MGNHFATNNDLTEDPGVRNNTSCGLGSWNPQLLQKFASPKVYLVFFCLNGIVQGIYFTYLIGISSTLEKRYSYDSKITAIILLADNISPAIFSIILGYFGRYIHKPKLVYFGMLITMLSCILACFPYFLFGSKIKSSFFQSNKNYSMCSAVGKLENCHEMLRESVIAVCFLFTANFLKGIGSSAFYTVGTPYLDDNVKKKNSPMYLGMTFAMRVFGPSIGFWFSSFCLKYYENPSVTTELGIKDTQWIGAWWIGFLVLGFVLFLSSFPILCFPRYMQNTAVPEACQDKSLGNGNSFCNLFIALKKVYGNRILMFHTLSIIFQINGFFGYLSFMPKYIENQFHNSASSANWYSGQITFWASAPVLFISGFVITRFKPKPRFLTGYMMLVQLFAGTVMISALFIYCQANTANETESFLSHDEKDCNSPCFCNETHFSPICDIHGVTHFSPCSAGCLNMHRSNITGGFGNCSCIDSNSTVEVQATKGICTGLCSIVWLYIVIITITKFLASSARVGNILITLRCVDEADKTLALGAVECLVSIFATIPNPMLYGYLFDKSCLLWEESCGVQGNCLFYDSTLLRYYIHSVSIGFILLGACCDFIVFMLSSRLNNFYCDVVQVEQHNQELGEDEDL